MAVKSLAQSSLVIAPPTNSLLGKYQPNAFHHLETVRLGAAAASVSFANLSRYSDYQHLQIRYSTRASTSGGVQQVWMQVNADTASNYRGHVLRGTGASLVSGSVAQGGTVDIGTTAGNTAPSGSFAGGTIDLLDAFDAMKYKTARSLTAACGDNQIELRSWLWMNTAALTEVKLAPFGDSWLSGSRFSLYGIKARS